MSDSQRDIIIAHVWIVGAILRQDWTWPSWLMLFVAAGWIANAAVLSYRDSKRKTQ